MTPQAIFTCRTCENMLCSVQFSCLCYTSKDNFWNCFWGQKTYFWNKVLIGMKNHSSWVGMSWIWVGLPCLLSLSTWNLIVFTHQWPPWSPRNIIFKIAQHGMYCFIIYLAGVAISRFGSDDKIPADDFNKNRVCAVLPRWSHISPSPLPSSLNC